MLLSQDGVFGLRDNSRNASQFGSKFDKVALGILTSALVMLLTLLVTY